MKYALAFLALAAPLLFPWPLTAVLALGAGFSFPVVPLIVGIFTDALYYSRGAHAFPLFSVLGLVASVGCYFVRRFLKTSIMRA